MRKTNMLKQIKINQIMQILCYVMPCFCSDKLPDFLHIIPSFESSFFSGFSCRHFSSNHRFLQRKIIQLSYNNPPIFSLHFPLQIRMTLGEWRLEPKVRPLSKERNDGQRSSQHTEFSLACRTSELSGGNPSRGARCRWNRKGLSCSHAGAARWSRGSGGRAFVTRASTCRSRRT